MAKKETIDKEIEDLEKTINNQGKIDKSSDAYLMEKVPVKLVKDKQHLTDEIVRVNGFSYQIQRGKTVMVPRFVKEVLDNKERQEQEALERSQELQIDPNDLAFK